MSGKERAGQNQQHLRAVLGEVPKRCVEIVRRVLELESVELQPQRFRRTFGPSELVLDGRAQSTARRDRPGKACASSSTFFAASSGCR